MLKNSQSAKWGQVFELVENKHRVGFGFSPGAPQRDLMGIKEVFHSAGFIHSKDQPAAAILEDDEEQEALNFVTHGSICQSWIIVDLPSVIHLSK